MLVRSSETAWRKVVTWGGEMCSPVGARQKKGQLRGLWGEEKGEDSTSTWR